MNIGVSGASGHLGSATVRELKACQSAKANIVAISRTPDKIARLGVETRGDGRPAGSSTSRRST